jgi:hypothetical protein
MPMSKARLALATLLDLKKVAASHTHRQVKVRSKHAINYTYINKSYS